MSFSGSYHSTDSHSYTENPAKHWSNNDIERNFLLARKIIRHLHLKLHVDNVDKGIGTPSSYALPYECNIFIDNFLPEHMCVKVRRETSEMAIIEAKREFCKCLEANCIISMPMYDAWVHIYPLKDNYPYLFERLAEKAKENYKRLLEALPSYINPAYPNPNFKREIDIVFDKVYDKYLFSGEQAQIYIFDLDTLGPLMPKFPNIYGTTPNSDRFHLIMYRLRTNRAKFPYEFDKYERELKIYVDAREEKPKVKQLKAEAFKLLEETIKELPVFGAGKLYLVGSTSTNTATNGSDLDIHLSLDVLSSNRQPSMLQLANYLEHSPNIISIIPIYEAVVPILQIAMKVPYDTIKVEVSSASPYSVYTTFLVKHYMKLDQRARYLVMLIKQWAMNYGLRTPVNGTMSGIALAIMVIHFLQCGCEPPILPNLQYLRKDIFNDTIPMSNLQEDPNVEYPLKDQFPINNATLGELFIAFFEYYRSFNFDQDFISLSEGCILSRDDLDIRFDRRGIYVDEPYEHFNTLRSLSDFSLVKHTIEESYHLLNGPNLEVGPPNFRRLMYNHASL